MYVESKWSHVQQQQQDLDICEEPEGNVGKNWRWFFMRVVGGLLTKWYIKVLVILLFVGYVIGAIWGLINMRFGLPFQDLTPPNSYLHDTYDITKNNFDVFMFDSVVFFPERTEWWREETKQEVFKFDSYIRAQDWATDTISGMSMFFDSKQGKRYADGNETQFNEQ